MSEEIRRRLRALGVVRGVARLADTPSKPRFAIEDIAGGRFHTTSRGRCFCIETSYDLGHRHGALHLAALLESSPDLTGWIAGDDALAGVDPRRMCFIDTETTGLSAGTGTMAFVVGVGYFSGDQFAIRQFFLRDPGDEPAMVEALAELLNEFDALASFNGRAFDVPILENRFILARIPPPTTGLPHLDLIWPSRRIWRHKLSSCSLGTLEREVLSVFREQADVPSGVIPLLYRDYLRTGDARDMRRVIYHNAIDILSLVTLAARLSQALSDPYGSGGLGGAELYGLARWYEADGSITEAEQAYRTAMQGDLSPALRARTLHGLGSLLKRSGRRAESFAFWQQLALEAGDDFDSRILAHVELAKYLEWIEKDVALAGAWTRSALAITGAWRMGLKRDLAQAELQNRLARLERKASGREGPNAQSEA
jgi:uncharacterized protein YprB with RNaseH-like and TPR domain